MKKRWFIVIAVCVCIICGVGVYFGLHYQHTSPKRLPSQYGSVVEQVHSSVDRDVDGVDDQTDILEGALEYIALRPKYYQTGYPDDEYGVCTDLTAYALKHAGYDVMELLQEDLAKNPEGYSIEEPDINIDFRRVKNLKVYFAHTAVSLTLDLSETDQWQGGDIVIFKNHIGIVSDHRNQNGVPYVIHHNDPWQTAYEQDILESREDIVGHYRVSE
jgi:hypothetical protein